MNSRDIRIKTFQLAHSGRENLVLLLQNLREIERYRLFSTYGFQSLFHYVTSELKFSEPEAQRRISAMRLARAVPSIYDGLRDGSMNLTNLCQVQTLLFKEKKAGRKYTPAQKSEIVESVRGKSSRQAMKILSEINPEMNRTRELTLDRISSEELREKLIRVRGLYAHLDANMSLEDLLHRLCDNELGTTARRKDAQPSPSAPKVNSEAEIRRQAWQHGGGACEDCGSTHAVQVEHIKPAAPGGETTPENLKLLCRNCNLKAAIAFYGRRKMGDYLGDVQRPYRDST